MGYYSYVNLNIEQSDVTMDQVAETVAEVSDDPDVEFWKTALSGNHEVKWYEYDEDMKKVSRQYPEALFILSGEGEEDGDRWVGYYQNGKVQMESMPEWIPQPFDPDKLK